MDGPDAEGEEQQPCGGAAHELAACDPQARPAQGEDRREERARDEEPASRGKKRRHRVDDDLDAEVRRAPHHPDGEERDPDVFDGSSHEKENAGRRTPVRTSEATGALHPFDAPCRWSPTPALIAAGGLPPRIRRSAPWRRSP